MSSPIVINTTQAFFGKFNMGMGTFIISKVRYINEKGIQITVDVDKNNFIYSKNRTTHVTVWIKNEEYSFRQASMIQLYA